MNSTGTELVSALHAARHDEKLQALHYRALAAEAEATGDAALAERFHDLHADEQHHLSRLTARLIELNVEPEDLGGLRAGAVSLASWREETGRREAGEIARYESLLARPMDGVTRALIEQILETERAHARELGGKWMPA